jgi:hypothetical protein
MAMMFIGFRGAYSASVCTVVSCRSNRCVVLRSYPCTLAGQILMILRDMCTLFFYKFVRNLLLITIRNSNSTTVCLFLHSALISRPIFISIFIISIMDSMESFLQFDLPDLDSLLPPTPEDCGFNLSDWVVPEELTGSFNLPVAYRHEKGFDGSVTRNHSITPSLACAPAEATHSDLGHDTGNSPVKQDRGQPSQHEDTRTLKLNGHSQETLSISNGSQYATETSCAEDIPLQETESHTGLSPNPKGATQANQIHLSTQDTKLCIQTKYTSDDWISNTSSNPPMSLKKRKKFEPERKREVALVRIVGACIQCRLRKIPVRVSQCLRNIPAYPNSANFMGRAEIVFSLLAAFTLGNICASEKAW